MSDWLDIQHGSSVSEKSIFAALSQYWEEQFHTDMDSLNVSVHYQNTPMQNTVIMPPTLKKLEGHIAFGLSVCLCVCEWVRLLVTFLNF